MAAQRHVMAGRPEMADRRDPQRAGHGAFTLIELLIVVLLLITIAAIVVPRFLSASQDARGSRLLSDLQTVRSQVEIYKSEHNGRGPHLDEKGELDTEHFAERLTGKTYPSGQLSKYGPCGPYLHEWPENPLVDRFVRSAVMFGWASVPPRDGTSGWYYNLDTCLLYPNSPDSDPEAGPAPAGAATSSGGQDKPQEGPAGLRLNGIMEGPEGRVAIINNQRVHEGQTIDNAKVLAISDYGVKLEIDGREVNLGMSKSISVNPDAAAPTASPQPAEPQETVQPAPVEAPAGPDDPNR